MSVHCTACDQSWPRDPALEVPCPACRAKTGQNCRRPSGHNLFGNSFHSDRDKLALQTLDNYAIWPAASQTKNKNPHSHESFSNQLLCP